MAGRYDRSSADDDLDVLRAELDAGRSGPATDPIELLDAESLERPLELPAPRAAGPTSRDAAAARPLPVVEGFRVVRYVGRGGQAVVYEAVQISTKKRVAMKIIPGGPYLPAVVRRRYEREVDALASVDHLHVVGIADRGQTSDGSFYLATTFVDGRSLDAYLDGRRGGAGYLALVFALFMKLACALHAVHRAGLVHRDLKPANVLVDEWGEPRLLDFGMSRPLDGDGPDISVTDVGQVLGSLPWASPEQARGDSRRLDARSDVYSLGVMLYHAIAKRYPYPVVDVPIRTAIENICRVAPGPSPGRPRIGTGSTAAALRRS